jgi:ribonuclease Y
VLFLDTLATGETMNGLSTILFAIVASVVASFGIGWLLNNRFGAKSLEAMKKRSDEAVRAARREAEKSKRKMMLEAKEQILRQRNKAERDIRSRRGQLQKRERDLKWA